MNRKTRFYLTIVFSLLIFVVRLGSFLDTDSDEDSTIELKRSDENTPALCQEEQTLELDSRITERGWYNYRQAAFCMDYVTQNADFDDSRAYRIGLGHDEHNVYVQRVFWRAVYQDLYEHDRTMIKSVADSLFAIGKEKQMNRTEFAEFVVSFVQDIPYSYVLDDEACNNTDQYDCLRKQRFGLLSPVEFLHTLYGDCDTRTLLLYTLLKHFNYSPMITNSWVYLHSVLLLDVNHGGNDYLDIRGKRYYFWETTGTGWQPGQLPPDCSDVSKWEIILD